MLRECIMRISAIYHPHIIRISRIYHHGSELLHSPSLYGRPELYWPGRDMTTSLLAGVAPPPKSKAAQLADLLPAIEAALAAGHPHTAIFDHLENKLGLALTYRYYQITLHRLRKRRDETSSKKGRNGTAPLPVGTTRPMPRPVVSDEPDTRFSYDLKSPVDDFFS